MMGNAQGMFLVFCKAFTETGVKTESFNASLNEQVLNIPVVCVWQTYLVCNRRGIARKFTVLITH